MTIKEFLSARGVSNVTAGAFADAALTWIMADETRIKTVLASVPRKVRKADLLAQVVALQARLAAAETDDGVARERIEGKGGK